MRQLRALSGTLGVSRWSLHTKVPYNSACSMQQRPKQPDARETPSRPAHDKLKKVRHAPDFFCRCKRVPGREIGCPETHETMGNGGDKWFRLGG